MAVGHHLGTVDLGPDVTYDQWKTFMISEWIPALNKQFDGDCMIYLIEGERGQYKESLGMLWIFKSVKVRNKYWPEFQQSSEAFNAIFEKLRPLYQELGELGEFKVQSSTSWIVF